MKFSIKKKTFNILLFTALCSTSAIFICFSKSMLRQVPLPIYDCFFPFWYGYKYYTLIGYAVFCFVTLLLFFLFWLRLRTQKDCEYYKFSFKSIFIFVLVVSCLGFLVRFIPLMLDTFIINDFYDLPEVSILGYDTNNNLLFIDNHKFINQCGLFSETKYDPRTDKGENPENFIQPFLRVNEQVYGEKILQFIECINNWFRDNNLTGWNFIYSFLPYYDKNNRVLSMGGSDIKAFEDFVFPAIPNKKELVNRLLFNTSYNEEFSIKNNYELYWQQEGRGFFHHHNFVLGTINEIFLGRPLKEVNFQYGFLNMYIIGYLCKLVGDINYQTYFRIIILFYILAFLVGIMVTHLILRDIKYTALFALVYGCTYVFTGQTLFYTNLPGLSPIRFPIFFFSIFLMWQYLIKEKKTIYFICLQTLLLFNVLCVLEFGIMLSLSVNAVLLLSEYNMETVLSLVNMTKKSIKYVFLIAIAVVFYFFIKLNLINTITSYALKGQSSFPLGSLNPIVIVMLLMYVVILSYLLFAWKSLDNSSLKYICLTALIYSMAFGTYYIWSGTLSHFVVAIPILAFMGLTFLKIIEKKYLFPFHYLFLAGCVVIITFSFYFWKFVNVPGHYNDDISYHYMKKSHIIYDWKNPRAKISSTTPDDLFNSSCDLINKYVKDKKGIYIFSKYDIIIPFLAGKYSAMPYPDLVNFVMNDEMKSKVINCVLNNKPKYIFVDTDINRNFECDFVCIDRMIKYESILRIFRLNILKSMFDEIKNKYHKIEQTELLSVWKINEKNGA